VRAMRWNAWAARRAREALAGLSPCDSPLLRGRQLCRVSRFSQVRREPGDVVGAGVVDVDVVAALRGWIEQRPGEGEAVGAATLAGWYCPGWLAGWLALPTRRARLHGVEAIRSTRRAEESSERTGRRGPSDGACERTGGHFWTVYVSAPVLQKLSGVGMGVGRTHAVATILAAHAGLVPDTPRAPRPHWSARTSPAHSQLQPPDAGRPDR
jgi:hypothetical protein